jgi:putative endonuclease
MATWYVYLVSNNTRTLYCGMTSDLLGRVRQHKLRTYPNAFTARYQYDRLVWFETVDGQAAAAKRERQIKSWRREKKKALIEAMNPNWGDLSLSWAEAFLIG